MKEGFLYRYQDTGYDTLVFVGNGAIRCSNGGNGWKILNPLFDQLGTTANPDIISLREQIPDVYGILLGTYAFKFRANRQQLYKKIFYDGITLEEWKTTNSTGWDVITGYLQIKKEIGSLFSKAEDEKVIGVDDITEFHDFFSQNDLFITLNWDLSIWNYPKIQNKVQLHGRRDIPTSLILPTELNTDDQPYEFGDSKMNAINSLTDEDFEVVGEAFRLTPPFEENEELKPFLFEMAYIHEIVFEKLKTAKKIVLWGIAANVYDAEFLSLLSTIPNCNNLEEVTIINTNIEHSKKIAAIIGCPLNIFTHYDPVKKERIALKI